MKEGGIPLEFGDMTVTWKAQIKAMAMAEFGISTPQGLYILRVKRKKKIMFAS